MRANCSSSSSCPANSSEEELPVGLEGHGNLKLVFTVVSAVMVGLVMFSFGCSVEIRKLWSHLRRPWGIAVGLLCQFGLMPLTAYLLAIIFSLKPIQAIAVLIMGCCPGGTVSNVLTFWVDGDMDLSISMTTCSTVAALGMMPLCLHLYTWSWKLMQNLTIPYQNIGITLVSLIVPVAFGICVNYRWPKQSKIILKIGAVAGGILLLVVAVTGMVLAKGWDLDITLLIISFIFPLVGHVTGFLLALLTHQSWQRCRTISVETGAQNIQLCITMLQLSFPAQHLVQLFNFALAYGLFQLLHGFLIIAAYQAYKRRLKNKQRRQRLDRTDIYYEKKPRETGVFLEGSDEAAVTLEPLEPVCHHRALEPIDHISSCE
ncbi:solute carrier family 10 member 6 [Nannospalax galili]|uniref:Solute carrier family 10 (sodium/bile acid cotransporter family), member 6 n=1 Tax=Nannospalax galili TaxID=1026970 RepID=A0A8C6Q9Y0_NANGA|nr:solute carrier family 10 member 6 [Nannospalax galili]XP_008849972.1 solute carrier family 10 member 6 [Nannospalax galili]XP_029411201.1 solute carrier family 10 member 6 [Nannospalax galili]